MSSSKQRLASLAQAAAFPKRGRSAPGAGSTLYYKGGPVLANPELVPLFLGPFTAVELWYMLIYLWGFADYLTSWTGAPLGMLPTVFQYGVYGATVGPFWIDEQASGDTTLADLRNVILPLQNQGNLPPFGPQRLFLIFTKGIAIKELQSPQDDPFAATCGEHDQWGAGEYYAVCPLPDGLCRLWLAIKDPFAHTMAAWQSHTSHEILEAATDPVPGTGWITGFGDEGADPAFGQIDQLSFGAVQRFVDNRQGTLSVFTPVQFDFGSWRAFGVGI